LAALQHPVGQEIESQTQPLWVQCWLFSRQAGALPQRQFPAAEQLFAKFGLHGKQLLPPLPHWAADG